jgi:hypothetical protein
MFGHTHLVSHRSVARGDAVSLNPQPLSPVEARVTINPQSPAPRWERAGIIIVGG